MSGLKFLLLGAGEFLPWSAEAERFLLGDRPAGHVAVVPAASAPEGEAVFQRWAEMGIGHYRELGWEAHVIPLRTREDAADAGLVASLEGAAMVFFSGGSPLHLARILDGTPFLAALERTMQAGAVFAGCSAGAMVAGARVPKSRGPAFWHVGLGLIPNVRFGVHWNRMPGYLPGLKELLISGGRRGDHFLGIDEQTAIAGDGSHWRVFGSGGVDLRDGSRRRRYRPGDEFDLG